MQEAAACLFLGWQGERAQSQSQGDLSGLLNSGRKTLELALDPAAQECQIAREFLELQIGVGLVSEGCKR